MPSPSFADVVRAGSAARSSPCPDGAYPASGLNPSGIPPEGLQGRARIDPGTAAKMLSPNSCFTRGEEIERLRKRIANHGVQPCEDAGPNQNEN